jgi:hypothetical protein
MPKIAHISGDETYKRPVSSSPSNLLIQSRGILYALLLVTIITSQVLVHSQVLHAHYLIEILHETRRVLKTLPNVRHVSTLVPQRITVCGDLHGKLHDLLLIFWKVSCLCPNCIGLRELKANINFWPINCRTVRFIVHHPKMSKHLYICSCLISRSFCHKCFFLLSLGLRVAKSSVGKN